MSPPLASTSLARTAVAAVAAVAAVLVASTSACALVACAPFDGAVTDPNAVGALGVPDASGGSAAPPEAPRSPTCGAPVACDTPVTSEHCGACGRSCHGAPCLDGACVLAPVGAADGIVDVAGRDGIVFVLAEGGSRLEAYDVGGAEPARVRVWALGQAATSLAAADGGSALVLVHGSLRRYPVEGEPEDVAPAEPGSLVAASAGMAYVAAPGAASVERYDLVSRTALPPLADLRADHLAAASGRLVVADGARLRWRVDASTTRDVVTFDAPIDELALVARSAYVVVAGRVLRVDLDASSEGSPAAIEAAQAGTTRLVGDAEGAAWLSAPLGVCAVRAARACDDGVRTLARDLAACRGLALVGAYAYVGSGNALVRQPR